MVRARVHRRSRTWTVLRRSNGRFLPVRDRAARLNSPRRSPDGAWANTPDEMGRARTHRIGGPDGPST